MRRWIGLGMSALPPGSRPHLILAPFLLELLLLSPFEAGNRGEKIFALQEKGKGEVVEEVF